MKQSNCLLALLLVPAFSVAANAQVQPPAHPGCTLDFQDHYRCNRDAFEKRLTAAKTIRVDTDRLDLFAHKHMQDLAEGLGKAMVAPGQRADLVFDLAPIDRTGQVNLSTAAVALATLTVYDTSLGTGARSRIWVETVDGDADKPWPGVVVDLIRKFQADALPH